MSQTPTSSLTNVTVDDTYGNEAENIQIAYTPESSWSLGQQCTDCQAHLDVSQVHNQSWHDTTYFPGSPPSSPLTASLSFDGVAIYVYCIVTRASTDPFGNSDMTFYIDGDQVGTFLLPPDGNSTYIYNDPVYVNTSIPSGQHLFSLQNGRAGGQTALVLLDYIVFSREVSSSSVGNSVAPATTSTSTGTPATTNTDQTPTGASTAAPAAVTGGGSNGQNNNHTSHTTIIAATVAAVVAVLLVFGLFVLYLMWRRAKAAKAASSDDAFQEKSMSDGDAHSSNPGSPALSSSLLSPPGLPLSARLSPGARALQSQIPDPYILPPPTMTGYGAHGRRKGAPSSRPPGVDMNAAMSRPLPLTPDNTNTTPGIPPAKLQMELAYTEGSINSYNPASSASEPASSPGPHSTATAISDSLRRNQGLRQHSDGQAMSGTSSAPHLRYGEPREERRQEDMDLALSQSVRSDGEVMAGADAEEEGLPSYATAIAV